MCKSALSIYCQKFKFKESRKFNVYILEDEQMSQQIDNTCIYAYKLFYVYY